VSHYSFSNQTSKSKVERIKRRLKNRLKKRSENSKWNLKSKRKIRSKERIIKVRHMKKKRQRIN